MRDSYQDEFDAQQLDGMPVENTDEDEVIEAYRSAAREILDKALGADNWDSYENDQTYVRNTVEIHSGPEEDAQGAWVAVLVWVPAEKV